MDRTPHVLIFPFPAQGHITQMLKLAELLCLSGIQVTFLNTHHNHRRLRRHADIDSRFPASLRFQTIPDGLPPHHPRRQFGFLKEWIYSVDIKSQIEPSFRHLLVSYQSQNNPVTCIISDGVLTFTIDVGMGLGIPTISFRTVSTCCLWTYFWLPQLVRSGDLKFGEELIDMDERVSSIPGSETFLRRRDLPSFYRSKEIDKTGMEFVDTETQNSTKSHALILNTFEDLESPILSEIRNRFTKIYTIGPLHTLLNTKRAEPISVSSNGLWEVDRTCMKWLDSQTPKSVIYVSFGSVVLMKHSEMMEIWHGLVNSEKPFLWVVRPDSITEELESSDEVAELVAEETKKRGCIVGWAPQEEVLAHGAVGGFLGHGGWNSTLESVVAGVPLICWPHFADQTVNSRFVEEVWRVGLDMKDRCDRSTVEMMVRDLMDEKGEGLRESTARMGELARESVRKGGSSFCNFKDLMEDLRLMCQ